MILVVLSSSALVAAVDFALQVLDIMADRNRLAAEKQKLEERKQRLSVITSRPDEDNVDGSIVNIEKGEPEKSNGQKTFDYLFKIVIIGDAVSDR